LGEAVGLLRIASAANADASAAGIKTMLAEKIIDSGQLFKLRPSMAGREAALPAAGVPMER